MAENLPAPSVQRPGARDTINAMSLLNQRARSAACESERMALEE
ncbi:hypothetical protein HMPREF7215_1161 [Pyramidobacter piscolens W5455]|uniref:Uncharacterized protein n=1 Tax=Pyramidobacter piscolens W5455 TaxID=352165 RepID=A0ABM9ZVD4_9BACT|nr:hypothetical protein HMPREF7215_1161 [Pyramidobacter piscolens W5455]